MSATADSHGKEVYEFGPFRVDVPIDAEGVSGAAGFASPWLSRGKQG
jgi:hypothetical protein